ncbi:PD40 domain-containing protein [bacterium]|nr:PD40 domain-containing protein [bacterium]
MRSSDSGWTPPAVAPFSGDFFDGSPSISPDGEYLFFSSARTPDQKGRNETGERTIWFTVRTGDTWSTPRPLGIDLPGWENGTRMSGNGYLYFDAGDIYRIPVPPPRGAEAVRLDTNVNSAATELHPCVAPDERFIVFYSSRPGHYGSGGGDLYISFRNSDGTWSKAGNLGEQFNKGHLSTSFPGLTPDGMYFFFLKLTSVPWQCEVFWVAADVLDNLQNSDPSP